ncbi:MAG: DUF3098 domain-containing protein [Prevotellaceae bacterium]|nr:DUF3098 domain-containing protein [Prevotellaceae bacterium]MDD5992948.1 DUF3098 domain-containing protein [Prevotellaceae bacterium]MDD6008551.1 DUF3098 domain-containing protein [Prevotellaceae bacterium]MDD6112327.1 DUF3098 domain-containing protein [Prevotellaceae bacterium]MDD6779693.1 DUF3098 domain-containing protein [Prevotellaceae bacterium]
MMDKKNFAFDRMNYILLAIGMAIVVIGFLLMSGSGSTETNYDPDIFSARRIKLAPAVCLFGFVSMIYAVIRKPKA